MTIDITATVPMPTPSAWKDEVEGPTIQVIPLVPGNGQHTSPGWCSYDSLLKGYPDVEIFCGGINTKTSRAAGLWRQGNLLHFGFDLSPAQMNETGRKLLVNSIHYIARFTEDRPTARVPSPFAGTRVRARASLLRWLKNEDYPVQWVTERIDPELLKGIDSGDRAKLTAWFEKTFPYLRLAEKGLLTIDEEAQALGFRYDEMSFYDDAIGALAEGGVRGGKARTVLARYGPPERPGESADAKEWTAWLAANRPYLFYQEHSSYRWTIDPLAKKRGVSTADLRGALRADIDSR